MNDSEAACFGAEALEYHCSVCDFVRLAVRPVNSDFDIFIRILFYLNKKWREDARKLSRPRHGLVNTKQLPVVLKLDLNTSFFFFGGGGRSSPNEMACFAGIVWSQFVFDFKTKHTVAKPFSLPTREWVVCENLTSNYSVTVVQN